MAIFIPELNRKPDVFLSHSSLDKDFVRKLANDLNVCEIDVWLDEWEIAPGDSIYNAISDGIRASKYVALVISKSFLTSKWSSEELEFAFNKQVESGSKVILPILVENVELPPLLKGKLNMSFVDPRDYYWSFMLLAGLIHGVDLSSIIDARLTTNPQSLKDVVDGLNYCGIDPYMIIPKDVFNELAKTGKVSVSENRLRFFNLYSLVEDDSLSGRTRNCIRKIITRYGGKERWYDT